MTRVLVTGCAGYIGTMLCNQLLADGYYVIGVDNLMYNNGNTITHLLAQKNFHFVKQSVLKWNMNHEASMAADVFIPLAAIVGAPACDKDPSQAKEVNEHAIYDLVNSLPNNKRIIFPNTNSGYGANPSGECTETSPLNPVSLYGITKNNAEKAILSHPNSVSLRLATVCGVSPRMRFDLLVNDFVAKLYFNQEITIYEPAYMRNYVHIRDVVNAFMFMIESKETGVFNLGHPSANLSKFDLAAKIAKAWSLNPNEVIKIGNGKDPDQRNYVVSNKKILDAGFVFENSIDTAINEVQHFCELSTKGQIMRMGNLA